MSDQSLRDAQLRQEFRAEIMRGYQAALCNSDIPGWTLGDEVAKVADNLLALHPAEPAPVVTDEAVRDWSDEAFAVLAEATGLSTFVDGLEQNADMCDDSGLLYLRGVASRLGGLASLLGRRPLLDREAVREKIADWYSAHYNPDHDVFYEKDDRGVKSDEDENAMHAYRGFQWAQELARPMPTPDVVAIALFEHDQEDFRGLGVSWSTAGIHRQARYLDRANAVLALLNGAES